MRLRPNDAESTELQQNMSHIKTEEEPIKKSLYKQCEVDIF